MMQPRMANIVSVTVTALLVTAVVVCLDPLQCRRGWDVCSAEEPFLVFMVVPIQTCARECRARAACGAVNYWRHRRNLSACATCDNQTVCDVVNSSCVVKECRKLRIDNAVVHGNRLEVDAVVHIVCTGGYTLEPPWPYAVCQSDGSWSTTPVCIGNITCSAPPTVAYATVATGNTTLGAAMYYKCDLGFELNGTSASVTCGQDGNWTAVEFQCLKACSAPPTVAYATVATGNTTLGAAMYYKCDLGFELNGTSASVTCGQDGNWTAVEFQCLKACSAPPTVAYATVATGNTTIGSIRNYTCDPGFVLNGTSASVTCGQDGNWTAVEFQCLGAGCESGWHQIGHSCYSDAVSARDLNDAKSYCHALGGYLLQTETGFEFESVFTYLSTTYPDGNFWLGLTDEVTEGTWLWMETGAALTFSNWAPNNPNGNEGDNYVKLKSDGLWVDKPQEDSWYEVVCEKRQGS